MKVIIAGSRDFNDYDLLKVCCDVHLAAFNDIEIVSGTAKGADRLGERYANERGYQLRKFPADWSKHGKVAGLYRNADMGWQKQRNGTHDRSCKTE